MSRDPSTLHDWVLDAVKPENHYYTCTKCGYWIGMPTGRPPHPTMRIRPDEDEELLDCKEYQVYQVQET